ncbi:MAG: DnaJ domain-containing protein [Cryomorphaceae bacterium]|nr:DnaJ domain-containing protein [Cryomorphaceae bacterium]
MQHEVQKQRVLHAFQVLELKPTTSWKKIRHSYRSQAKIWHPDTNSSQEAKSRTVEINEAYEYLTGFFDKAGRLNDPSGIILKLTTTKDHSIKTNHRGEVKKRLIRFYNNKLASEDRSKDRRVETILIHLNFWFCLMNVLILPPVLAVLFGWNGFLLSLTSNFIFILFTMSAVRNLHHIKWTRKIRTNT